MTPTKELRELTDVQRRLVLRRVLVDVAQSEDASGRVAETDKHLADDEETVGDSIGRLCGGGRPLALVSSVGSLGPAQLHLGGRETYIHICTYNIHVHIIYMYI